MVAGHLRLSAVAAAIATGLAFAATGGEPEPGSMLSLGDAGLVEVTGIDATIASPGADAVRIAFTKRDEDRRLLAVRLRQPGLNAASRSLTAECRFSADGACSARFTAVALEGEAVWGRAGAVPLAADVATTAGLPLDALRETSFAPDPDGRLDLAEVGELWVGVAIDGAASGVLELSKLRVSPEPCRASAPLDVPFAEEASWQCAADPAVDYGITAAELPDGGKGIRVSFSFPGGRHMYLLPSVCVPSADLDTYGSLQIVYRATLPAGIGGLLVALNESEGAQYYSDPAPPAQADFGSAVIPFTEFRLGSWSRDSNGRLDASNIRSIVIGAHGTAQGEGGEGRIEIAGIRFLP